MQQGPGGVRGEEEGGRGKGEGRLGFWQVAARQRGGVCVEISLGKLCTTLDHGTLRVGIRVSCHISNQKLMSALRSGVRDSHPKRAARINVQAEARDGV